MRARRPELWLLLRAAAAAASLNSRQWSGRLLLLGPSM
jgi:hypothetical protein